MDGKSIINKFVKFINKYNAVGYGKAYVVETSRYIVIELWNAGWSGCEMLESKFIENKDINNCLRINSHPITVFAIDKIIFEAIYGCKNKDFDKLRFLSLYEKQESYKFEFKL